jgi:hypothetical protein
MLRFCGYRHPRTSPWRSSASGQWAQDQCNYGYGTCHCGTTDADLCFLDLRTPEHHFRRLIALEISGRNARVAALQKRWDRLRAGLDLVLDQRGAGMADPPGGASGILRRDYKGRRADRLGSASTPAWSRWSTNFAATRGRPPRNCASGAEERKVIDASPAAIRLALLLTDEEGIGNALVERSSSREERRTNDRQ